jgi:DNA-binding NarL/FixJ family response regulator
LLLAFDHSLLRESLAALLRAEPDFYIVGKCGTAQDALEVLASSNVDLALVDFQLPEAGGNVFVSVARRAGYRGKVLMVTAGMSGPESLRALQLGASGIFLESYPPESLIRAIRLVAAGEAWVDEKVIQLLVGGHATKVAPELLTDLTLRERQVLKGILDGLTNRTIGNRIGVSEGTVKATVSRLFRKAAVHTRSQLVRAAIIDKA